MYICLCNPFTDKDVESYLRDNPGKAAVSAVYKCCSGGEAPNCCSCIPMLKDIVRQHNGRVTVQIMGDALEHTRPAVAADATPTEKEAA